MGGGSLHHYVYVKMVSNSKYLAYHTETVGRNSWHITINTENKKQWQRKKLYYIERFQVPTVLMAKGISLHFVKIHKNFHQSYGILVHKYNDIITLQKEQESPLNIRICFQARDKIITYVSARGHCNCTTFQHSLRLPLRQYRSVS